MRARVVLGVGKSCLERCPQFRSVLIEGFHSIGYGNVRHTAHITEHVLHSHHTTHHTHITLHTHLPVKPDRRQKMSYS